MCPPVEETPTNGANGHSNGANGANGVASGSHEGFSAIQSTHNPHPHNSSPYKPVGDFLSNVSRFKVRIPVFNYAAFPQANVGVDHRVDFA
jgi:homocitrate synthase